MFFFYNLEWRKRGIALENCFEYNHLILSFFDVQGSIEDKRIFAQTNQIIIIIVQKGKSEGGGDSIKNWRMRNPDIDEKGQNCQLWKENMKDHL